MVKAKVALISTFFTPIVCNKEINKFDAKIAAADPSLASTVPRNNFSFSLILFFQTRSKPTDVVEFLVDLYFVFNSMRFMILRD